jgi:hypothetical protein
MRLSRIIRYLEVEAVFALAAAPGFVRAPIYRASPPMAPGDVAIVIVGCAAIVMFGIIVMVIWSRTGARS